MWLKVILVITAINCSIALRNPPLVTKWRSQIYEDVTPFILDPPQTYRIPNDTIPLQYKLHIRTDISEGLFNFTGYLKVQIQVTASTITEVVLHSKQHTVTNVDLYNSDLTNRDAFSLITETIESHDFLVIKLLTPKRLNDIFWLDIVYNGVLRDDGEGFYRGSYVNQQNQTVWYGTTQFEITEARHAFPCYDEPGIRAPIQLEISYKEPYYAVSNMPVLSTFSGDTPGYMTTLFKISPPMQTYLLAFLVSDYKSIDATSTRIPQKVYAVPKAIQDGWANYAASVVGAVVRELENYIGFEYQLPKLDHAALTTFKHGAMENFGLITYIDNGLLLNPNEPESSKIYRENGIVGLIAHETAHQWFGDIISPSWWSYTWLNEGFATLFANYIPHKIYPERNILKNFIRSNLPAAFGTDELNTTWSMNHYTEDPPSLWTKFNNIGYSKAACVLRMFQETMTEETFAKGLKYYFQVNNMTAATPDTLHTALQNAYDEDFSGNSVDIGTLMGTWENQAGYPMVSVQVVGTDIEFTQKRYPLWNGEIYSIPLTFSTKTFKNFNNKIGMQWMTQLSHTIPTTAANFTQGDWIILNNQQVGYYRVDYSHELWHPIMDQLRDDHTQIHAINRAVLQDELYLGWKSFNRITADEILESMLYFKSEDEAISWSKANKFLSELKLRLSGSDVHEHYFQFIKDITSPQLTQLGYESIGGEHTDIMDLRNQLKNWNCEALEQNCLLNEHQKWLAYNSSNVVSSSFNFCYALALVDTTAFDQILKAITSNVNYPSRANYLSYLGCNLIDVNLKSLLDASIDTNILTQSERLNLIKSVFIRGKQGLELAINFIEEKHAEVSAINSTLFGSLITQMVPYVNPKSLLHFIQLRDTLRTAGYLTTDDSNALNLIYLNTKNWHDSNYDKIETWLKANAVPVTTTSAPPTSSPLTTDTTDTPLTTPQAASSIFVSLNALIICVILSLIFTRK